MITSYLQRCRRRVYFALKRMGPPPTDQEGRLALAQKLLDLSKPNYRAVYFLFDSEKDLANKEWLYIIGRLHDQPTPYFNQHKALTAFQKASDLGHGQASFRLGEKHEEGVILPFDLKKALRFYKKAKEGGYIHAESEINRVGRIVTEINKLSRGQKTYERYLALCLEFRKKGLGIPPISSDDRYKYALDLTKPPTPDHHFALSLFFPEADSKHPDWLHAMGYAHENIEGFIDKAKSIDYYRQASTVGHSQATYTLARMHEDGSVLKFDIKEAQRLYALSKEQGFLNAQPPLERTTNFLSEVELLSGDAHVQEKMFGLYHYFRKNQMGTPPVSIEDRFAYANSLVHEKRSNHTLAIKLFILQTDSSHKDWLNLIAESYDELPKYKDTKKSVRYYAQASKLGHAGASNVLARKYEYGKGVVCNPKEALRLYTLAGDQGQPDQISIERLSIFLSSLDTISSDPQVHAAIFELYRIFAEKEWGFPPLLARDRFITCGQLIQNGEYELAYKMFIPALDSDGGGWLHLVSKIHGYAGPLYNPQKSLEFLVSAANLHHYWACYDLGQRYENGNGVPIDLYEALRLYDRAKDSGDERTQQTFKKLDGFLREAEEFSIGPAIQPRLLNIYKILKEHGIEKPLSPENRLKMAGAYLKKENFKDAEKMFIPELDSKDPLWMKFMAYFYEQSGDHQDFAKYIYYLQRSSELGNGDASYQLGKEYKNGEKVPEDLTKALQFYRLAKYQGSTDVEKPLSRLEKFLSDLDSSSPSVREKLMKIYNDWEKGRNIAAMTSDERFYVALPLITSAIPDYKRALTLFVPEIDESNHMWLSSLAYIYDKDEDNPYFDPQKAFDYNVRASQLGSSAASYNLGRKYFNGNENEIDIDAAVYWFQKAKEQGDADADYSIVKLIMNHDDRYLNPQEKKFRESLTERIKRASDAGSLSASRHLACLYATGRDCEKSTEKTISLYERAVEIDPKIYEIDIRDDMILNYAFRAYLGFGVTRNYSHAKELLDIILDDTGRRPAAAYIQSQVKQLRYMMSYDIYRSRGWEEVDDIKDKVRISYENNIDPRTLNIPHKECSVNVLWCIDQLASAENWLNKHQWTEVLRETQAKLMGLNYADIVRSTQFEGPRYNPKGSNGMPVLGVWERPSPDQKAAEQQMIAEGSYVPEAGVVKFKGLSTNDQGTITFDFIKASDQPAFLLPEDFEIVLTLAFGSSAGSVKPYLSLEDPNRHGIEDKHQVFKFKEWNPHWLGYTDLGRTLYITDQLIGRLTWMPKEFDVGPPNFTFNPAASNFAIDMLKDINLTGGRSGAGTHSRVMLLPEHVTLKPPTINERGHVSVSVLEVKMRIDGDYLIVGEGKDKDLHLSLNDDNFRQGRTVNKLTRRYTDIAAMMPVFARAQELMALMESARVLRDVMDKNGLKLNPDWHQRIKDRYKKLDSMPPLPKHELLCVPLPLHYKGYEL